MCSILSILLPGTSNPVPAFCKDCGGRTQTPFLEGSVELTNFLSFSLLGMFPLIQAFDKYLNQDAFW